MLFYKFFILFDVVLNVDLFLRVSPTFSDPDLDQSLGFVFFPLLSELVIVLFVLDSIIAE